MSDFNISMIRNAAAALAPHVLRLFVKAENLQTTGSFKLRGALNKVLTLDEAARRRGVITFSAGNHGQAVAAAAKIVGCPATIVLPKSAPQVKVDGCRWWGAQVVFYDPDAEDRRDVAQRIIDAQGWTLVHPFDDPHVMAGQGTVGLEIVQQLTELGVSADAAIVNCSGGGLASGVDMASCCQEGEQDPAWFEHGVGAASSIGDAAGSSVTTVDQADMRALGSDKTVVRHGAASL
jgi:threonine dehydratase